MINSIDKEFQKKINDFYYSDNVSVFDENWLMNTRRALDYPYSRSAKAGAIVNCAPLYSLKNRFTIHLPEGISWSFNPVVMPLLQLKSIVVIPYRQHIVKSFNIISADECHKEIRLHIEDFLNINNQYNLGSYFWLNGWLYKAFCIDNRPCRVYGYNPAQHRWFKSNLVNAPKFNLAKENNLISYYPIMGAGEKEIIFYYKPYKDIYILDIIKNKWKVIELKELNLINSNINYIGKAKGIYWFATASRIYYANENDKILRSLNEEGIFIGLSYAGPVFERSELTKDNSLKKQYFIYKDPNKALKIFEYFLDALSIKGCRSGASGNWFIINCSLYDLQGKEQEHNFYIYDLDKENGRWFSGKEFNLSEKTKIVLMQSAIGINLIFYNAKNNDCQKGAIYESTNQTFYTYSVCDNSWKLAYKFLLNADKYVWWLKIIDNRRYDEDDEEDKINEVYLECHVKEKKCHTLNYYFID